MCYNCLSARERKKHIFTPGDKIVHPRYGTGIIADSRTITRNGEVKTYVCVELNDRYNGTIMIPEDQIEEVGLRYAKADMDFLRDIMNTLPEELSDNHRARQADLESKIKSGKPRLVAQALRDLCWREHVHKLTQTDTRLKKSAMKKLLAEASIGPKLTLEMARQRFTQIIDIAMQRHSAQLEAAAS